MSASPRKRTPVRVTHSNRPGLGKSLWRCGIGTLCLTLVVKRLGAAAAVWTASSTSSYIRVAWLGFTTTYKTAGTAKLRGSRTRHHSLWVGLWVEKVHEFCGNPHLQFLEIRSSARIILRRRFGKPSKRYLNKAAVSSYNGL